MDRKKSALDRQLTQAFSERGAQLHAIATRAGEEEAADLIQDAFLKTVEAAQKDEVRSPVHLLYRIARNAVIDRLRRKGRWAKIALHDPNADAPDPAADPERRLIAAERLRRVIETIESMPARRREVFLLHRVEELSYALIARRLGIGVSAVEKHIRLAMAQLSREIDERR